MQRPPTPDGDRPQHRLTGQLVPEGDLARDLLEHANGKARVDRRVARAQSREQVRVDAAPDDAGGLDGAARLVVEAGEARRHGVADGGGQTPATSRHHLGHEEGVPARDAMELVGVDVHALGQAGHGGGRQRREAQAGYARRGREVAQDDPQRVACADLVVAVRREDERARVADAAAEEAQQVEGGLVGPVDVLEHGHGRLLAEHLQEVLEDGFAGALVVQQGGERRAEPCRHVDQRPERARRPHRVTATDEQSPIMGHLVAETPDERRLADPRLAADEHEAACAGHRCPASLTQRGELLRTFEEFERWHVWPC